MGDESPAVVRADEGYVLHAFGQEVTILLDGERTNGRLDGVDKCKSTG